MKPATCLMPAKQGKTKTEKNRHSVDRTVRITVDKSNRNLMFKRLRTSKEAAEKGKAVTAETLSVMCKMMEDLYNSQIELFDMVNELTEKIESHSVVHNRLKLTSTDTLRDQVLKHGEWYEAKELSKRAGYKNENTSSMPNRWKKAHKIFAISADGKDLFPGYALGDDGKPLKSMEQVLQVFDDKKSSLAIAAWFASVNSWLNGSKPMDVINEDPNRVIQAAKYEVSPIVHG